MPRAKWYGAMSNGQALIETRCAIARVTAAVGNDAVTSGVSISGVSHGDFLIVSRVGVVL
jgi:hypothetical protein